MLNAKLVHARKIKRNRLNGFLVVAKVSKGYKITARENLTGFFVE